jgi:ABC-type protease/lipase transport system fused ATPase/permease subunit
MNITRVVVAHRPALLQRAHRVLLVKDRQLSEIERQSQAKIDIRAA